MLTITKLLGVRIMEECDLYIGYACLTVGLANAQIKSCRKTNATEERLKELIQNNLNALETMVDYNIKNNIHLYRISSDLIPFGSAPNVNDLRWEILFKEDFDRIGKKMREYDMRVSMHPGQYTVLNSPDKSVVEKAKLDLEYHAKILDTLKMDQSHKIVLHIGGVYGDKESAIKRFVSTYETLSEEVKKRLIIENDDRLYTVEDVLQISKSTGVPVVYDNLHNQANKSSVDPSDAYWIEQASWTWGELDGKPKVHYSQQRPNSRIGAHTKMIYIETFMDYYEQIKHLDVDIMLEVKGKNLSTVKCILSTTENQNIHLLEQEWARYKYLILEYSPSNYQKIRILLKDKSNYPAITFYGLIEEALNNDPTPNQRINAADHIFGHLKNKVTEKEENSYNKRKETFLGGGRSLRSLKNQLFRLAEKYDEGYLTQSLYFSFE